MRYAAGPSHCCRTAVADEVVVASLHPGQHRCVDNLAGQSGFCRADRPEPADDQTSLLNLAQLNSQSLEPLCVDLRGIDQTSALPSHDDHLKVVLPLEVASQRQSLDWLNAAGGSPLARPVVLSLELTSHDSCNYPVVAVIDWLQLQSGTPTLQSIAPLQLVVTPQQADFDQLLWNGQALKAGMSRPGTYRGEAQGVTISSSPAQDTAPIVPSF